MNSHDGNMDFCHEELGTSILKDDAHVDGDSFCLNDLLSSVSKNKLWMTEYFVKPPVNITLRFSHPLKLSSLSWCSRVKAQVSSVYEFFHPNGKRLIARSGGESEHRTLLNTYELRNGESSLNKERFYLREPVSGLIIVIRKTISSSNIPCISNLQIWGRPCCSQEVYNALRTKWLHLLQEQKSKEGASAPSLVFYGSNGSEEPDLSETSIAPQEPSSSSSKDASPAIPSEFLDSLTFNRMNIPMILPSGNVIDKATLDRHVFEESKWGRAPSDPFTWKLFSERSKPLFDSSLKARIDAYVLKGGSIKRKFLGEEYLEESNEGIQHKNEDCLSCGKLSTTLYRLPCRHLMCQVCVLKFNKDIECSECAKSFSRGSITRYHFIPSKRFCY
eukprot:TRINITY_DN2357_c0_g1_i1.p1 TRINITY_DN2357_c0_g1~~TRINITY_DN2357_c0_g1_i1.p1  ORF type:complete len:389 (-),score=57.88 TRINITY_DN2357_c0_g1_i1:481-1647(-)